MFMVYHFDMEKYICSFGKWHSYKHLNGTYGNSDGPDFEEYKAVALVDVPSIDDVFRATNHITEDWTTNPEIVALPNGRGQRSTSVGDMVTDLTTNISYRCASVGWEEVILEGREAERVTP